MLRQSGLVDVHHSKHPYLSTVSTCNKNTQNIPVDGIWASPSLDCVAAGYYGYGELTMGKTDHRMIWADFSYESVFGFKPPEPEYNAPQRLTLADPRVVRRYNQVLLQDSGLKRLLRFHHCLGRPSPHRTLWTGPRRQPQVLPCGRIRTPC